MIEIQVKGEGAIEAVHKLARKARNLSKPMQQAGLYMERETKLNFAKQSDPDGAAWAALKASTLRRKRSGAILRETSALMGSISMSAGATEARVTAGTDYGVYHQSGTSKMAQRKIIGIGDRHIPKIRQIFEAHFKS